MTSEFEILPTKCCVAGVSSPVQAAGASTCKPRVNNGRHTRHDSSVASTADRAEMDVQETPRRPPWRARGDPAVGGAHGRGEPDVGLHADPRRAEMPTGARKGAHRGAWKAA